MPSKAWTSFWQSVAHFDTGNLNPSLALRNTLGITIPLATGVALGAVSGGLAVATGALNVSFSDGQEPYRLRARRMLAASALVALAVFAGALCGNNAVVAVVVVTAWAFAAGLLVALSTTAADLGAISLVTLVVYMAVPQPFGRAVNAGLLAFSGGLLQTLLSVAFWPLRRYAAERRILSDLYTELALVAAVPIQATQSPPASAQITAAQTALSALTRDHSVEAERYRLLLSQAERLRLSMMLLGRLRIRFEREDTGNGATGALDRYFEICSRILNSIGDALRTGQAVTADAEDLLELETPAEQMRAADAARQPVRTQPVLTTQAVLIMMRDARFQMDAIAGQLRSAVELSGSTTSPGSSAFEQREARKPWHLRLAGTLATLRANLSLQSTAFRHAIRLAACAGAGDALAYALQLRRSYWVPMTIAIVLKPDFTATFSRGILRLTGTFAGLGLATGLFHALHPGMYADVALIAVMMFLMRWIGPKNYGVFVMAVTALVVVLIAMTGADPRSLMAARGMNTVAGGSIALLAYWLWPTWERKQVSEVIARMLDEYRAYFRAVRESYEEPDAALDPERDRVRVAARLARSNLEASIDRLSAEPGTTPELARLLSGILASSHRMVHAMMALEAGLYTSQPVPVREEFRTFANDVELTLYFLAAALRGSPLSPDSLPDLREDHHALLDSDDAYVERYALVNVETDRIANSLNTLTEEIAHWLAAR
jgi:uncharacterized membrane protein YccC